MIWQNVNKHYYLHNNYLHNIERVFLFPLKVVTFNDMLITNHSSSPILLSYSLVINDKFFFLYIFTSWPFIRDLIRAPPFRPLNKKTLSERSDQNYCIKKKRTTYFETKSGLICLLWQELWIYKRWILFK